MKFKYVNSHLDNSLRSINIESTKAQIHIVHIVRKEPYHEMLDLLGAFPRGTQMGWFNMLIPSADSLFIASTSTIFALVF